MTCKNCGKQLYDSPNFCPHCGQRVESAYHGAPDPQYARETVGRQGTGPKQPAGNNTGKGSGSVDNTAAQKKSAQTKSSDGGGFWFVVFVLAILWVIKSNTDWLDFLPFGDREPVAETYRETYVLDETETTQPVRYADEIILDGRDSGPCGKMTGDIGVMYIFMDDANSYWTQQEIDAFLAEAYEEMNILAGKGVGWEVDLTFWQGWEHCATDADADSTNTSYQDDEIIQATGRTPDTINQSLAQQLGTPQAYPVFIFNEKGRAFASVSDRYEACFLFEDASSLRHESCHLFGAADLYYTKDTTNLAKLYLGDSLMIDSGNETVDELTAYLMGWTDELYSCAVGFLEDISWMTQGDMFVAAAANTVTGYGTREYSNGARYEGNLYCGVPHGEGTLYYEDGTWVRGNFDNGQQHGWCEIYYVSGDYFQGEFINGDQIGRGSFTWKDGTWFEGDMKDCHAHGYGTMHYSNGQVRTGNWDMNTFLG